MRSILPPVKRSAQEEMIPAEVTGVIEKAHETFQDWRQVSFAERARLMN